LFVSQSVVEQLGAQRIVPEPQTSAVGDGGITYTFPASALPATVDIALEPSFIGVHDFRMGVVGSPMVRGKVLVMP
jgi:hypothetical protein